MAAPANTNPPETREKDFENGGYHSHLDNNVDPETALRKIQTSGSISISPELFEKIYLSPQNKVAGELRKTFGNPTPIALGGFLLSLSPLSCDLMGWRGAGGNGAASEGAYFFFGGLLMILGGLGEWILGNTFPGTVFLTFGAFWLTFAATLQPFYNAYGAYSPDVSDPAKGLATQGFNASFSFFLIFMGVLCFIYLILAFRTNIVFVLIFLFLIPSFGCLAGAFFSLAQGKTPATDPAITKMLVAAGAMTFVVDMLGWWIFAAILLASLDFPFQLPVGDLSHIVKGASEMKKKKEEHSA